MASELRLSEVVISAVPLGGVRVESLVGGGFVGFCGWNSVEAEFDD